MDRKLRIAVFTIGFSIVALPIVSGQVSRHADTNDEKANPPAATSLLGVPLYAPEPSETLLAKYAQKRKSFEASPNDPDKLIWYGRFAAYCGNYNEAIEIFTNGIKQFPEDARMLRHRGHRFISIRKFDKAIDDLEAATKLIKGKKNQVEPDGMPNEKNIPVSTLHGNIWYHLGLAYYLKHDYENALRAYRQCRDTSTNPDNVVSSTHWLYMIQRRLGRTEDAKACLSGIERKMDVIENHSYHNCCLMYKGLMTLEELAAKATDGPSGDSIRYAIANWHDYQGNRDLAKTGYSELLKQDSWSSFGYIAAEADWCAKFANEKLESIPGSGGM